MSIAVTIGDEFVRDHHQLRDAFAPPVPRRHTPRVRDCPVSGCGQTRLLLPKRYLCGRYFAADCGAEFLLGLSKIVIGLQANP